MISFLTGKCFFIDGNTVWILTPNGVGYEALASKNLLQNCHLNEEISAFIVSVFKQDDVRLFAFNSIKERSGFLLLTSVQGVGSKVALSILSSISIEEVLNALIHEDITTITRAEGVGPKLAKRIINELKDKSFTFVSNITSTAPVSFEQAHIKSISPDKPISNINSLSEIKDTVTALVNLGYHQAAAHTTVLQVAKNLKENDESATTEVLIKGSLQLLKQ